MIVVPDGDGLVAFAQEAHAWLAGDLATRLPARHWEPSAFVAAARVHDNGWREADRVPTIDGEGRPHRFYQVPAEVYVDVWRRGIARAAAVDAIVGLLVGLHGARFFGSSAHDAVRALHDEERTRQDRVLAEVGLGGSWRDLPPAVRSASDWIAFLDQLSLVVCGELDDETTAEVDGTRLRVARAGDVIAVDPWPFAAAPQRVSIEGRRLAEPTYPAPEALWAALADAPPLTRTRTLQPR